jgi:hypothetical protein
VGADPLGDFTPTLSSWDLLKKNEASVPVTVNGLASVVPEDLSAKRVSGSRTLVLPAM